jgi:hypothetical protein
VTPIVVIYGTLAIVLLFASFVYFYTERLMKRMEATFVFRAALTHLVDDVAGFLQHESVKMLTLRLLEAEEKADTPTDFPTQRRTLLHYLALKRANGIALVALLWLFTIGVSLMLLQALQLFGAL